jgi:selenocysteine lyase/cysteine desulfurase
MSEADAVFLSPHKFVGGPGTPGVLVAKRALFKNRVPTVPEAGEGRPSACDPGADSADADG